MTADDQERIVDMLTAIERIETTARAGRSAFEADADKQDAILYRLQIIGDAASRLSADLRTRCPEVPWRRIIDLRHVLVHDYGRVDHDRIWDIVEQRLPQLRDQINDIRDAT